MVNVLMRRVISPLLLPHSALIKVVSFRDTSLKFFFLAVAQVSRSRLVFFFLMPGAGRFSSALTHPWLCPLQPAKQGYLSPAGRSVSHSFFTDIHPVIPFLARTISFSHFRTFPSSRQVSVCWRFLLPQMPWRWPRPRASPPPTCFFHPGPPGPFSALPPQVDRAVFRFIF